MNLAREILLAEQSFRRAYQRADVWQGGLEVMQAGTTINNVWYIEKVKAFLVGRLKAKKKRGGGEY